jgi:23S rRNA-/tRNA-specific pseudouridylate synthase
MSHIGYPLIADTMYGGKVRFPKRADEALKDALKGFDRQAFFFSPDFKLNNLTTQDFVFRFKGFIINKSTP